MVSINNICLLQIERRVVIVFGWHHTGLWEVKRLEIESHGYDICKHGTALCRIYLLCSYLIIHVLLTLICSCCAHVPHTFPHL